MSEIRINIIDENRTISGDAHGFFGDALAASLAAEPETVEELELALQRFIKRETENSPFCWFRDGENFEPWDAGLLVIDLAVKVVMVDSTYSSVSKDGKFRIETDEGEDFWLPYQLSDDWEIVYSLHEYNYWEAKRREEKLANPLFDVREILFGTPLFEFITREYSANKNSTDEDLFTEIHAKWLMTEQDDLRGKTPRQVLLEKRDFIEFDLHSRSLQWSVTSECPPPIPAGSKAFLLAGFGIHEIVVYYDLFRFLLGACFENDITNAEDLEKLAADWMNDSSEYSGRTPASIIESERRRVNLTVSAHECMIDEDCDICQMLAAEFDSPMFWHLDGSHFEFDCFEFSFHKSREEWETEQREYEEFNREFAATRNNDFGFSDENEILL